MRFHGIMVLRDEGDVVAQTLDHLLTWIDALYVLDVGSTDHTWNIVQDYAHRDPRIVPFMSRPILFNDILRGYVFDRFRDRISPGDWVLRTDADEFYQIPPPRFVAERLRPGETAVDLLWYYFRLTKAEVQAYESGRVNEAEDRKNPIEQRRRFYQIARYCEPRMFRHRRSIQWSNHVSFPYNAGFVARERIPIRHYPHRDPSQMQRRFQLRSMTMKIDPLATGDHWKLEDWHKDVFDPAVPEAGASAGVGLMAGLTDPVHEWLPGTDLPEVHPSNHLAPPMKRLMQRLVHPLLLPILDRTRPAFNPSFQPTYLPEQP